MQGTESRHPEIGHRVRIVLDESDRLERTPIIELQTYHSSDMLLQEPLRILLRRPLSPPQQLGSHHAEVADRRAHIGQAGATDGVPGDIYAARGQH